MAKALQCPDCGHRHSIDDVADRRTFRCDDCRRLLKVPASLQTDAASTNGAPTATTRVVDPDRDDRSDDRTEVVKVPPSQRRGGEGHGARPRAAPGPARGRVSRKLRAAIWLAALPLGLVPVFVVGRSLGLLGVDTALDAFIGVGWTRFAPVVIVLVVWAALTATLAHVTLEALERRRTGASGSGRPGTDDPDSP